MHQGLVKDKRFDRCCCSLSDASACMIDTVRGMVVPSGVKRMLGIAVPSRVQGSASKVMLLGGAITEVAFITFCVRAILWSI